jgi:LPS-assembly protein
MAELPKGLAALLSACWCASVPAAGDPPLTLRLERSLSEVAADVSEGRPLYGRGDTLSGRPGRDITLEGDAELRRAGTAVRAGRLTYYVEDDEVVAVGNVRVTRQGNVFAGPELRLRIDAREGFFLSPTYELPLYRGRGRADSVEFQGPNRTVLANGSYTTCRPGQEDWLVSAETLVLDDAAQEGTGRSASIYFKNRRILAAPMFGFALGEGRRSGFLAPTYSLTSNNGFDVVAPYYWNIAPNRDFTLYPRLIARRGLQIGGHARYLEPTSNGDVRFEYNPSDTVTGDSRYFWSFDHRFTNLGGWAGAVLARGVSDDNYFVDYSRTILASSSRVLPREVLATRSVGNWTLLARATSYQSILDARNTPPYERLPQFVANHVRRDLMGFDSETTFDVAWFQQPLAGAPEGLRVVANPRVSYPVRRPGWFVVPKLNLHMSTYQLDSNAGNPTSLSRVVPVMSVDSGMVFERPTRFFGRDVTQTLEPRLYYAFAPYRDQDAIPVFDTGAADFNFAQLFSDNTFVGQDRIADVNQLTAALVSRMITPATGAESLRVALGQRFYFSSQRVSIPGQPPRTDEQSDILLAANAVLGRGLSMDGGLQYSIGDKEIPRFAMLWRYLPGDGRILNFGVRYLKNEIGSVDTSWRWPLADRWVGLGRINYSWLDRTIDPTTGQVIPAEPGVIEGVLGFEYNADCWTTRIVTQRFVTAQGSATTAFFIQLELNGLARIGSSPFDILRRNIPGYRLPTDRPATPSRFFGYE